MLKRLRTLWNDRRGNALIIAAGALPLIIGSAGLASDTIQWSLWKRQLQRAADSAAYAGVYAQMQGQTVDTAVSTDLSKNNQSGIALLSGYPQIAYPTGSGYTVGTQVTLAIQKRLSFSSVFMSNPPTITATSTAGVVATGQYCVVSLESAAVTGITATGSTGVNLGCGMITNSTSLNAAVATGASSVTASPIAAVGGIQSSTHFSSGTQLLPFTIAEADPFKNVTPTAPTGNCANDPNVGPQQTVTLQPGCYKSITIKGTVTLAAGTYYIDGGDFTTNAQATVDGTAGVTIVLSNHLTSATAPIGTVTLNGGATLKLTAPDSGTYAGIAIYQDRRATPGNSIKINGNSGSKIQGAMYFPTADLTFNGTTGMTTACMQLVGKDVTFTGNSAISNVCPTNSGSHSFMGQAVRLVA